MQESNVIDAVKLTKKFGDFTAVDGIDLNIREGELFGLLGPNGAGKSTTIYMLSTILTPSSGYAVVNGFDVVKKPLDVRKSIGIVFQDSTLDTHLTGFDNLDIHGRLYGMSGGDRKQKIKEVLELVELSDWSDKLVKTYSGGMRRRLEIARGLLHTPRVLFLDEPTLGLDPQTRRHIWEYLRKLKAQGVSMVLTTHYLEEADELCDKIAIIDSGRIKALGTSDELKKTVGETMVYLHSRGARKLAAALEKAGFKGSVLQEGLVAVNARDGGKLVPKLVKIAEKNGIAVESVEIRKPSLEDVFLHYTGKAIRGEGGVGVEKRMRARMWGRR